MNLATERPFTLEAARERLGRNHLAIWLGFQLDELEPRQVAARMMIDPKHIAPNGFLHAGVGIALADITCGLGSIFLLRGTEENITTIELKSNHLGTATAGLLFCKATARHVGSSTHVWDADVMTASGNTITIFRCTQMVLRPRSTTNPTGQECLVQYDSQGEKCHASGSHALYSVQTQCAPVCGGTNRRQPVEGDFGGGHVGAQRRQQSDLVVHGRAEQRYPGADQ
jgi:uncharacterized protein (TIGR00369 family)